MASDETLQRARRIETRVTEIAIALGVGQGAQLPVYTPGIYPILSRVTVPSPHASIASLLAAIPDDAAGGDVDVFLGETRLCTIIR